MEESGGTVSADNAVQHDLQTSMLQQMQATMQQMQKQMQHLQQKVSYFQQQNSQLKAQLKAVKASQGNGGSMPVSTALPEHSEVSTTSNPCPVVIKIEEEDCNETVSPFIVDGNSVVDKMLPSECSDMHCDDSLAQCNCGTELPTSTADDFTVTLANSDSDSEASPCAASSEFYSESDAKCSCGDEEEKQNQEQKFCVDEKNVNKKNNEGDILVHSMDSMNIVCRLPANHFASSSDLQLHLEKSEPTENLALPKEDVSSASCSSDATRGPVENEKAGDQKCLCVDQRDRMSTAALPTPFLASVAECGGKKGAMAKTVMKPRSDGDVQRAASNMTRDNRAGGGSDKGDNLLVLDREDLEREVSLLMARHLREAMTMLKTHQDPAGGHEKTSNAEPAPRKRSSSSAAETTTTIDSPRVRKQPRTEYQGPGDPAASDADTAADEPSEDPSPRDGQVERTVSQDCCSPSAEAEVGHRLATGCGTAADPDGPSSYISLIMSVEVTVAERIRKCCGTSITAVKPLLL